MHGQCSVGGCEKAVKCKSMCMMHYERLYRKTETGKAAMQRYNGSDKARACRAKQNLSRLGKPRKPYPRKNRPQRLDSWVEYMAEFVEKHGG